MSAARLVRRSCLLLAVYTLALLPLVASADIPGPGPRPRPPRPQPTEPGPKDPAPKPDAVPLEVVLQDADLPLRIEIPRGLLPKVAGARGEDALGGLENYRTILAGLALALAVSVVGVWAVRRFGASGKPVPKTVTAGLVLVMVVAGLAVASAWGDLGPRPNGPRRPIEPEPVAGTRIQIVVVEEGEKVVLRATPTELAKMFRAVRAFRGVGNAPPTSAEPHGE